MTAATANAQTTYVGPWQPRPTIGIALGAFDEPFRQNNHTNLLLSGTFEFPFSDEARLRIEAGRSTLRLPVGTDPAVYRFAGNARVSRLTVSIAGLKRPGDATGYGGIGIGFYRVTQDKVKTSITPGMYVHGGAEVPVSDSVTLNAEIGVHIVGKNFVQISPVLLGEAVIRLKVGL
jgi:opacity protein-like surface antigen